MNGCEQPSGSKRITITRLRKTTIRCVTDGMFRDRAGARGGGCMPVSKGESSLG